MNGRDSKILYLRIPASISIKYIITLALSYCDNVEDYTPLVITYIITSDYLTPSQIVVLKNTHAEVEVFIDPNARRA